MEEERDPTQGALSLLQVSGNVRTARLDKMGHIMVHPQSGREGPRTAMGSQAHTAILAQGLLPG